MCTCVHCNLQCALVHITICHAHWCASQFIMRTGAHHNMRCAPVHITICHAHQCASQFVMRTGAHHLLNAYPNKERHILFWCKLLFANLTISVVVYTQVFVIRICHGAYFIVINYALYLHLSKQSLKTAHCS
jgi:hypothetical protein